MDSENQPSVNYKDFVAISERISALEKFEEQTVRGLSERDADIDVKFKSLEDKMGSNHRETMDLITVQMSSMKKDFQEEVFRNHESLKEGQDIIAESVIVLGHEIATSRGFLKGAAWVSGGLVSLIGGFAWIFDHKDVIIGLLK